MLKTCVYCGRVHDSKMDCPKKPKRKKTKTEQSKFRSTSLWAKKSKQIQRRDKHLCQICIRKLYKTVNQFNDKELSVHHIIPIRDDYELRLNDDNLITLCTFHHKMADHGDIPQDLLIKIAAEQNENAGKDEQDTPGGKSWKKIKDF